MFYNFINCKKQLVVNLLILFLIRFLLIYDVEAEEREWKLMGKTDNSKFLLYIDTKSISYELGNILKNKD